MTTDIIILALLDYLLEEFKNEPDYKFIYNEYSHYESIMIYCRGDKIGEICIINGNINLCQFVGLFELRSLKYSLLDPNSLRTLVDVIIGFKFSTVVAECLINE